MLTRIAVVVSILPIATSSLAAAQDVASERERFELFNRCQPMQLAVDLTTNATDIELTRERVRSMAERRLRATRLYDDQLGPTILHISINVAGVAFSTMVSYQKLVYEPASTEFGVAVVWWVSKAGIHVGDGGYILQGLSESLDRFVLEYLRVNGDACGQ